MIIGNVTADPESRSTGEGLNVCSFSVATNLVWTDKSGQKQQRPEFHNVVSWRKLADICAQYLKKGKKVYIEGRLQTHNWQGQDGVKRYKTEIIADNMIMLSGGPGAPSDGATGVGGKAASSDAGLPTVQLDEEIKNGPKSSKSKAAPATVAAGAGKDSNSNEETINIEDIPF